MAPSFCPRCGSPLGDSGICGLCDINLTLAPMPYGRPSPLPPVNEDVDALTIDWRPSGYYSPSALPGLQRYPGVASRQPTPGLGLLALGAAILLALSIALPSISRSGVGVSAPLWRFGYLHVGYETLRAASREHRYPAVVWWVGVTLVSPALALVVSAVSVAARGRVTGWILMILGALTAIGAPVVTHLGGVANGVGVWTTIAGGCLVVATGIVLVAGRARPRTLSPGELFF
jgi:hypothetical protein